jgi:hypothetical protein
VRKIIVLVIVFCSVSIFADSPRSSNHSSTMPDANDSSNGALDQGGKAEEEDKGAMILGQIGTMVGTMYAMQNAPTCFGTPWATCPQFIIGVVAAGVGMAISSDAAASGAGAANTRAQVRTGGAGGMTPEQFEENSPAYQQYVAAINELEKAGFKVDKKTGNITTPKGTVGPNTTAADLAAMGISMTDEALKSGTKGILDKAKERVGKYMDEEWGNSGGSGVASGGGGYADTPGGPVKVAVEAKKARGPADLSGLSKMHGGTPIGVAGDDLFMMMKRRYEDKGSQGAFLILQ